MRLENLSPREQLYLCRRAEQYCARLLRALGQRVRGREPGLADLLLEMAKDEDEHHDAVHRLEQESEWPDEWRLDENGVRQLLRRYFDAFDPQRRSGDLSPGETLALVERLEIQSSRFYRRLAAVSPEPRFREFYLDMAEQEEAHIPRPERPE